MLKALFGSKTTSDLLNDALDETYSMLEREAAMFEAACDALFEGKDPEIDVVEEDEDIDVGERMVRRLVFQHVNLNPT
ncbi:MAG: hypothetical protein O7G87_07480, partial [bacterium]|nr:hypothetical protein [bacterium]